MAHGAIGGIELIPFFAHSLVDMAGATLRGEDRFLLGERCHGVEITLYLGTNGQAAQRTFRVVSCYGNALLDQSLFGIRFDANRQRRAFSGLDGARTDVHQGATASDGQIPDVESRTAGVPEQKRVSD